MDDDACYRALLARDPRFDGVFFTGVSTTGIYCRPICPARTPGRRRCTFFHSAALAEQAGFRACFRCRPELAPGMSRSPALPELVDRALCMIQEGYLDRHSVRALAAELGVSTRHLRRVLIQSTGVSPVQLAQTRRLALAKRLLHDTDLRTTEVAYASGFRSLRRFNDVFQRQIGRTPSDVRSGRVCAGSPGSLRLRLDYRPPLDWSWLLDFLEMRTVTGVERVDGSVYRRLITIGEDVGVVGVSQDASRPTLWAEVPLELSPHIGPILRRLRHLFDLDAEPVAMQQALGADPTLRRVVRAIPGLRVPGSFDPFETAVRAVLGQQVSVKSARTLAGRLVHRFGQTLVTSDPELDSVFPTAGALSDEPVSEIQAIGLPRARAETLHALAAAVGDGHVDLSGQSPPSQVVERLLSVRGIGPWTASYVAMRSLRAPDVFLAADLGVRQALGGVDARVAETRAEAWRPWRSYSVMYLWALLGQRNER